jgi:O-antigen ligase
MNIRISSNHQLSLSPLLFIALGALFGVLLIQSPFVAAFALVGVAVLLFVGNSPLRALAILVFLIPFSATPRFVQNILPIPGGKPLQLLALFVLLIALLNYRQMVSMPDYVRVFVILFLTLFCIAVFRSISYLDFMNLVKETKLSPIQYLLSDLIKPLIYFLPFILILKFSKNVESVRYLMNCIAWSLIALSVYFLLTAELTPREDTASFESLGLHRNAMANFYIVGFPMILARYFLKKDLLSIVGIGASIVTIGFMFSRTAYVLLILSFVIYLLISKRTALLPFLVIIGIGASTIISANIIERASKGLDEKNVNTISAGRIENIWIPVIEDYLASPGSIVVGKGRYGVLSLEGVRRGFIRPVNHPHNMYLDIIVDSGIIGLVVCLSFIIALLSKALASLRQMEDNTMREFMCAAIVGLICYLIAGITGRTFYPMMSNSFFWMTLGMMIVLIQFQERSRQLPLEARSD